MRERRNYGLSVEERRRKRSYNNYLKKVNLPTEPIEDIYGEVWRPIVWKTRYMVSNMGRVKTKNSRGKDVLIRVYEENNTFSATLRDSYTAVWINIPKVMYESFVLQHRFKGNFHWRPLDGNKHNLRLDNISTDSKMRTPWYNIPEYKLNALMDAFWTQEDNRDSTLAKEFDIKYSTVRDYISYKLDLHFNKIDNR